MGLFNDVFRAVCDEVLYETGEGFAHAWNSESSGGAPTIDGKTVERWRTDVLPAAGRLPGIVRLVRRRWREKRDRDGNPRVLSRGTALRLKRLLPGADGPAGIALRPSEEFLARMLEAAYRLQQEGRRPSPVRKVLAERKPPANNEDTAAPPGSVRND